MGDSDGELLFSYGRLQHSDVQRETFGRRIDGCPDAILGATIEHSDAPHAEDEADGVAETGDIPNLRWTGDARDRVFGTVLALTPEELDAADEHEVTVGRRREVDLASGRTAWAYVTG